MIGIDLQRAYSWLSQFSPPQLRGPAERLIQRLQSQEGNPSEQRAWIYSLAYLGATAETLPVRMEAFAQAGFHAAQRGLLYLAREFFGEALVSLPADTIQAVCIEWCLGCVLDQNYEPSGAYGHWNRARTSLVKIFTREEKKSERDNSLQHWFQQVYPEMNDHLTACPEEAYACMRPHNRRSRAGIFDLTIKSVAQAISRRSFLIARKELTDGLQMALQTASMAEYADACAYASLAEYEMGNVAASTLYLDQALSKVPPESFETACLHWMRGSTCWQVRETSTARVYLTRAAQDFETLEARAVEKEDQRLRTDCLQLMGRIRKLLTFLE